MNGLINEHLHGGIVEYVDRLLDEKIMLLKKEIEQHIDDKSAHVTEEDKQKWNEPDTPSSSSSSSSGDATSSAVIPTHVSDLKQDIDYLKRDDLSYYATEEEVRSWLNGYWSKEDVLPGGGSSSEDSSDDEVSDEDIIDKFRVSPNKTPLNNTKYIGLQFNDGKLSIKAFNAQTASLSTDKQNGIEYKTSSSVTITVNCKDEEMQSYVVSGGNLVPVRDTKSVVDQISNMVNSITYTLNYTPKEDNAGTASAIVPVTKRYYTWYNTNANVNTIPNVDSSGSLSSKMPSQMTVNGPANCYIYIAYPTSWGVDISKFMDRDTNYPFVCEEVCTCNGPSSYGETNNYKIVRSKETSLGQVKVNTNN